MEVLLIDLRNGFILHLFIFCPPKAMKFLTGIRRKHLLCVFGAWIIGYGIAFGTAQQAIPSQEGYAAQTPTRPEQITQKSTSSTQGEEVIFAGVSLTSITMLATNLALPLAVAVGGWIVAHLQHKRDLEVAKLQTLSHYFDALADEPSKKRAAAIEIISLLLPRKQVEPILKVLSESDPDDTVKSVALDQTIKLLSDYQRTCLEHMHKGDEFIFRRHSRHVSVHKAEIRSLFSAGLIQRKPGPHGFRSIFDVSSDQDINHHFDITDYGKQVANRLETIY